MSALGGACLSEAEGEEDDEEEKKKGREEKHGGDARDDFARHDVTEEAGELSRDFDGGSFHGTGLPRKASWENVGSLNNLQQLRR